MALSLRHPPAPPTPATPARRSSGSQGRKPFLDNTPVLLAGILALMLALAGMLALGSRSSALAPDLLADVVLYALKSGARDRKRTRLNSVTVKSRMPSSA